jgi:hypothetical protein
MDYFKSICHNADLGLWDGKKGRCTFCYREVGGVKMTEDDVMKYRGGRIELPFKTN